MSVSLADDPLHESQACINALAILGRSQVEDFALFSTFPATIINDAFCLKNKLDKNIMNHSWYHAPQPSPQPSINF